MRDMQPYNTGELRLTSGHFAVMIVGHIWWPVEKCNAYHCLPVDQFGEPKDDPQYIWDTTDGKWPVFEPKERVAA